MKHASVLSMSCYVRFAIVPLKHSFYILQFAKYKTNPLPDQISHLRVYQNDEEVMLAVLFDQVVCRDSEYIGHGSSSLLAGGFSG